MDNELLNRINIHGTSFKFHLTSSSLGNGLILDNNDLITLSEDIKVNSVLTYDQAANKLVFTTTNSKGEEATNEIVLNSFNIVDNVVYDAENEKIIIKFITQTQEESTLEIPVSDIIAEWNVSTNPSSVILEKVRNVAGTDILSAKVNISTNEGNQLVETVDKALYVAKYDDSDIKNSLSLKADKTEIPSLDGYAKSADIADTYQVKGDYATKAEIPSLDGYAKSADIADTYQVKGDYATKAEIPSLDGYAKSADIADTYQVKGDYANASDVIANTNAIATESATRLEEDGKLSDLITALEKEIAELKTKTAKWVGQELESGKDYLILNRAMGVFLIGKYGINPNNEEYPTVWTITLNDDNTVMLKDKSSGNYLCISRGSSSLADNWTVQLSSNYTANTLVVAGEVSQLNQKCEGKSYKFSLTGKSSTRYLNLTDSYELSCAESVTNYNSWLFITEEDYKKKKGIQ